MSSKNDISQIRKYHNGELDARAMHELERRALDDPFLMAALEGYEAKPDQQANLDELTGRLQERADKKVKRLIPWTQISIAASVLILLAAGILFLTNQDKPVNGNNIALNETVVTKKQGDTTSYTPSENKIASDAAKTSKQPGYTSKVTDTANNPVAAAKPIAAPSPAMAAPPVASETRVKQFSNADSITADKQIASIGPAKKKDTAQDILKRFPANASQLVKSRADGVTITTPQNRDKNAEEQARRMLGITTTPQQNINLQKPRRRDTADLDETVVSGYAAQKKSGYAASPATANDVSPVQNSDGTGRMISGHIISKDDGQPIIGATVKVFGRNFGVVTDLNGKYILKDVPKNSTLIIGYIGYYTQKVKTSVSDTLDVALYTNINATQLTEVTTTSVESVTYENAQPSNGWAAFKKYADSAATSPDGKTGKVRLSFTVDKNGNPGDFKIIKSLSKDADQKAIDIIKNNQTWEAASDRKPQTVKVTIKFH